MNEGLGGVNWECCMEEDGCLRNVMGEFGDDIVGVQEVRQSFSTDSLHAQTCNGIDSGMLASAITRG